MKTLATNRQKKLLRFFDIDPNPNLTIGAAGWEIANILSDDAQREMWRRYVYLTNDLDSDSDQLLPFDDDALDSVIIPEGWHSSAERQKFKDELVASLLVDNAPFDSPQLDILFTGNTFAFTGKFSFGSRKDCQKAVTDLGGIAVDKPNISRNLHYLVIGTKGSPAYKRGSYGTKIEKAIIARREAGSPAIVSEDHWLQQMGKEA